MTGPEGSGPSRGLPENSDNLNSAGSSHASAEDRTRLVERLFREHNRSLLRFLFLKLHSEQEARDVAQEAYVRVLNLDSPETVSHLRAFLFKTAANIAIDRARARARMTSAPVLALEFFEEERADLDPARGVAAREELDVIARALDELTPKCRQAFLMRRLDGLSSAEIAVRMQIPERTVRYYIVEAIVYCRRRLDETLASATEQKK
jgi:RNA polymerase sigma factor (sigma-70 family)